MTKTLTLFTLVAVAIAHYQLAIGQSRPRDYSNWMKNLDSVSRTLSVTKLAIPGSHNSFTRMLDVSSEIADDSVQWIEILNRVNVFAQPVFNTLFGLLPGARGSLGSTVDSFSVKTVAHDWSKNQDLTVQQQLALGIRFFDARLGYQRSTGRIRIVHGLYGRTLASEMLPIAQFARSHPDELIVIRFMKLFNFNLEAYSILDKRLMSFFGDTLLWFNFRKNETGDMIFFRELATISLNSISTEIPGNVIVTFNPRNAPEFSPFWPDAYVRAIREATTDSNRIMSKLESVRLNYALSGRTRFFLEYEGVPEADGAFIAQSLLTGGGSSSIRGIGTATRDAFTNWLREKMRDPSYRRGTINLCTADFVNKNFVDAVLDINNDIRNA